MIRTPKQRMKVWFGVLAVMPFVIVVWMAQWRMSVPRVDMNPVSQDLESELRGMQQEMHELFRTEPSSEQLVQPTQEGEIIDAAALQDAAMNQLIKRLSSGEDGESDEQQAMDNE